MSIPTPFNPLGTLGSSPLAGYVTDGLILAFDALLEKSGRQSYLTNWVSGTKYQLENEVSISDGVITPTGYVTVYGEPVDYIDGIYAFNDDYSVELCAIKNEFMSFCPWIGRNFQFHNNEDFALRVPTTGLPMQYFVPRGTAISAYLDFIDYNTRVFVNGEAMPLTGAGMTIGSFVGICQLATNSKLHAYRLYSRKLSQAEQKQNYAMDAKRFNLT